MTLLLKEPVQVLLVEDNPADVEFTEEGLRDMEAGVSLHVARDGADALAFLRREGRHGSVPRPHLILLDLNLPGIDGHEVLKQIKSLPDLATIPVVVLSSSSYPSDVGASYALHANCYVVKPMDLDGYVSLMRSLVTFWVDTARLPRADL